MIEQPQNLGLSYKGPVGKAMIDPEKQQATLGPRIRRESEKAKLMRENELFAKKDQATKEEAKREIAAIGTRMKKTSIVKKISRPVLPQIQQEEGRIGEEDATLKPYPTLIQWPSLIVHLKVPSMYKPASQPGPLTPRDHRQLSQTANNGVPLIDKKRAQSPENPSKLTQPPKPRRRYVGPRFSMNLRGSGASKVSPPQLATTAPIAGKTVQPEAQGPPPALHGKTPGIAAPPPAMAMEVDEQPIDREDQDNDPPTMSTQSTLPIREKRKTRSSDPIQPTLPQTTDMPTPRPRKMQKIAIAPEPFVTHTSNSTSNSNPASKPKVKPGILKQHPRTHSTSPRPGPGISEVGVPRRQSTRRIPDPPHMPTMPALPVQKTPKAQRDFQNGAMIALENVLEVRLSPSHHSPIPLYPFHYPPPTPSSPRTILPPLLLTICRTSPSTRASPYQPSSRTWKTTSLSSQTSATTTETQCWQGASLCTRC
ncbi:hypothetical protein K491DRAFT_504302 [Lophiostoma macrostomum CBS 122681]|uniref:Uncharacterized protein n=1 Tax=Lophiostoma macrostomum CBS 122681 TaxID=1314788 RepID=A0A6A6TPW0_9PLEO|nr:hypothetical protein K491DRAFT_504302 [Lophiostoma macrostomum CBS 122681]